MAHFIPTRPRFISIQKTLCPAGLLCLLLLMADCRKQDQPTPAPAANSQSSAYGSIRYTLTTPAGSLSGTEVLDDNSYCSLGAECTLSLADPKGRFLIGVIQKGTFRENSTHCVSGMACSMADDYSLAKYTRNDAHNGIINDLSFQEGSTEILSFRPADNQVRVRFHYALRDPNNQEEVSLDGIATLTKMIH